MTEFPVVSTEVKFEGRIITVRVDTLRMPDGSTARRELVAHDGAVGILALDEQEQVVLVNQYRPAVKRRLDELPAGLLDVADEPPWQAAQRELAEEAGLSAATWHTLLDLNSSPGFSNESIRIFLARDLSSTGEPDGFEREHEEVSMTVTRVPLAQAVDLVLNGEITNAAAVAGISAVATARARDWAGLRPPDAPWPSGPERLR